MKKIITALLLISLVTIPAISMADEPTDHPGTKLDLWDALEKVINYLFALLIIVAVIFLLIAGILFVTAQGDPDKVKKARDFVLWALIGVIVGVLAYALVNFVQSMVGVLE